MTIKADSLAKLLTAVATFRATNGLPVGQPAQEVEAYYAIHHPWLITKVGTAPVAHEDPVARWVNRQWRTPPKERDFAESETVRSRLETCATCEYYATAHKFDADTLRRLTVLGVGRITDFSACKAQHWAVGLAALIQTPETQVEVEQCWARRTGR